VRVWQLLFGEFPVRDFVDHGAPLTYAVAAAVQILFGRGTLSEIAFCATHSCCLCEQHPASRMAASGLCHPRTLVALVAPLLGVRFYNFPKLAVCVVTIPLLWAFANPPSCRRPVGHRGGHCHRLSVPS
jgi:hypothetical protein